MPSNNPNVKANLKHFKPNDPVTGVKDLRINRRGRIISGKETFRKEFEKIWAEIMFDDNGNPIIDPANEKPLTRLRAQMRAMTTSSNVRKVELAMAYTFGKPKEEVDLTSNGETIAPKVDNDGLDRSMLALADALREIVHGENANGRGKMDTPK
jgi:hypothetical protein